MRCSNCNYENLDNSSYCIMCGAKLTKKEADIPSEDAARKEEIEKRLVYLFDDNERINEDMLLNTTNLELGELIDYSLEIVENIKSFVYKIDNMTTLYDYICKASNSEEILRLLVKLSDTIIHLKDKGISESNLVLNINQIYIKDEEIKMICIPIQRKIDYKSLDTFLKEIIINVNYNLHENFKYLRQLMNYFVEKFDIISFRNFLDSILNKEFSIDENATTILNDEYDMQGTTLLDEENIPYLVRLKTSEKIPIDKDRIRIGKDDKNTDYTISDNPAVSRQHADILKKNGEYFIIDLGSTNHTYIDGKIIYDNEEVKIEDGNIIKLGNEKFEFLIH